MRAYPSIICLTALLALTLACSDDDPGAAADAGPGGEAGVDVGPSGDGGGGSTSGPKRHTCANPALTAPAKGTCTVTKGSGTGVLLRGTVLGPADVYENGHLLISGGKVACAGCDCSKDAAYKDATVVACAKGVISPGLINTHDHLGWTTLSPKPTTSRYDHRHEWRKGKNGKPKLSVGASNYKSEAVAWGELRMLIGGATSMMGANSGAKGLVRNLDGKTEGLSAKPVQDSTFPLGDSGGSMCKGSTSCYSYVPKKSQVKGYAMWVGHVAEGGRHEARNEFLALSGQLSGTENVMGANTSLIHAIGLNAQDSQKVAAAGAKVIWSPRSNISLYGYTAPVVMMHNLGVRLALGTDWTPSGSMNMLRELACAGYMNDKHYGGHFKPYQLWAMATEIAAESMGMQKELGQLKSGYWADISVFDGSKLGSGDWQHKAVVTATVKDVVLVLRAGKVLHGDTELVKALDSAGGSGCEALSDCLSGKSVCAKNETGKTLSELKTAATKTSAPYALFFCKTPDSEPTCVPSRPSEYDCSKTTAGDADCDGVQDTADTCTKFFNPICLMHSGKQPDTEGDKVGDECDTCPFDTANTTPCKTKKPDPDDIDGDGHKNAVDNCPYVANKDQKDTDGDKKGDACDPCPTYKNPGTAPCLLTVKSIRDPYSKTRPTDGDKVQLQKVVVTSLPGSSSTTKGFYVREGVGAFEAIYIYTGKASPQKDTAGTTLKLGDELSIEGKFEWWNSIDEIKPTSIKVTKAGAAAPAPVAIKTKQLKWGIEAEKWESHLIKVSKVKVAVAPTSKDDNFWVTDEASNTCSGTLPSCTQVGDFYYDGGKTNGKPANGTAAFKKGDTCTSITGVINGFGNKYALEPATDAGFVCP